MSSSSFFNRHSGLWQRKRASQRKKVPRVDVKAVLAEAEARGMDPKAAMAAMLDPKRVDAEMRLAVCLSVVRHERGR